MGSQPDSSPASGVRYETRDVSAIGRVDLRELDGLPPVTKLLSLIFLQAIRDRASDIHIQATEEAITVRYRFDGILYEMMPPPRHLAEQMLNRIKVMSGMESTEHQRSQSGRIPLLVAGRAIDLHVHVLPCSDGERAILRVADPSTAPATLEAMGMGEPDRSRVRTWLARPRGLILVAGVNGNGRTTLLYTLLREVTTNQRAILTVEDPIWFRLPGIAQVQVRADTGFGIYQAMEAALPQAPDVLMVGHLPDPESVGLACQAAINGPRMLSAISAADAPMAIARVVQMGVPPYLLAGALQGVVAQRLVRRLCPSCRVEADPGQLTVAQRAFVPMQTPVRCYRAGACDECSGTGYRGRIGVHESISIDEPLRVAMSRREGEAEIRVRAAAAGMRTMEEHALQRVAEGETSIEELRHVFP